MKIIKLVLGPLNTNCFLVVDKSSSQCVIIDPADEAELISEEILRQDLQPVVILATHGHFDHIMAAAALQMNFDLPFLIHQEDEFLVKKMNESIKYWLKQELELQPPKVTDYLAEGQQIEFGESKLEITHVPGHTPGGVCLVDPDERVVFTGDTLFDNGIGRTDFSYSLPEKMSESLRKIRSEFSEYRGYAGHGREFGV